MIKKLWGLLLLFIAGSTLLFSCASPSPTTVVVTAAQVADTLTPPIPTDTPPVNTTPPVLNLDNYTKDWAVYTEGAPVYSIQNANTPSLDGNSLQCSIIGGSGFSNVHCYQNLPWEPELNKFRLSMSFLFSPQTTCNNKPEESIVQAIEFTMSKWENNQRYEFALQWENVGDWAPQWRYWDASQPQDEQWISINYNIFQCLHGERWHDFWLEGHIRNQTITYDTFSIDDVTYDLGLEALSVLAPGEPDRLAVGIQLDGNSIQSPYNVFIDNLTFVRTTDCDLAVLDPIFVPYAHLPKSTRVSWTPTSCKMNVQFYQHERLVREHKSGDISGSVDMSELPSDLTEVKIWVPGSSYPSDVLTVYTEE